MQIAQESEQFLSQWGVIHRALADGASDILFCVGTPPCARIHGEMRKLEPYPLTAEQLEHLLRFFMDERLTERFARGDLDYTIEFPSLQRRFRMNIFRQHRGPAIVMRVLSQKSRSLEDLGLPASLERITQEQCGLVLVTGATGSGKSSTLAAIIDEYNRKFSRHIITIEDPIEVVFQEQHCVIEQREVGTHVQDFHQALRGALRQAPDIILVGEIRDPETAQMALRAAQVGILVLATMHTRSAAESISRYISMFEDNRGTGVRLQIAECLRAIVCQKLLPRRDGSGRRACCELLWCTTGVKNLIREDKLHLLHSFMEIAAKDGMVTMEQSLLDAYQSGAVSLQVAYEAVNDKLAFLSQLAPEHQQRLNDETDLEVKRLEQLRETKRRQMMLRTV